jgi:stage V sporulation protein AB
MHPGRERILIAIRFFVLGFLGLCSGFAVAAGVFAFVTMLGIIPRLAAKTKTAKYTKLYETIIVVAGGAANVVYLYSLPIRISVVGLCLYGFFAGAYVGCLAMALAEILRVVPIFIQRLKIVVGLPFLILIIGLGKCFGVIIQYFFL